jgi:hypothetical protein
MADSVLSKSEEKAMGDCEEGKMKEAKAQILELVVILVTISGLFLWSRSESSSDTRRMEDLISAMHQETYQEMKDFHGRLSAVEERNREKS